LAVPAMTTVPWNRKNVATTTLLAPKGAERGGAEGVALAVGDGAADELTAQFGRRRGKALGDREVTGTVGSSASSST